VKGKVCAMPLILSADQVEALLDMKEAIEALERGFLEYYRGRCEIPTRLNVVAPERDGRFILLPCYMAETGIFHTKIFSVYLNNHTKGLPNNYYYYMLHDIETGEVKSIMGGTYLTNVRTGAVQGIATKFLARKDSRVFALFGAGPVAEHQLSAIVNVTQVEQVKIFDPDRVRATQFAATTSAKYDVRIDVADSPKQAVKDADIITTATSSMAPVFDGLDVKPGTHVNAVGGINPKGREIDDYTITHSKIIVERMAEVLVEAGDIVIPREQGKLKQQDIHGELAEVMAKKIKGREGKDELTLFKSIGFAMEDAVIANLVYDRAIKRGLGQHVAI
jgi:ornithine cyclodeaminase/alanine dehydrogenase-like protein (mu-crystallin family)